MSQELMNSIQGNQSAVPASAAPSAAEASIMFPRGAVPDAFPTASMPQGAMSMPGAALNPAAVQAALGNSSAAGGGIGSQGSVLGSLGKMGAAAAPSAVPIAQLAQTMLQHGGAAGSAGGGRPGVAPVAAPEYGVAKGKQVLSPAERLRLALNRLQR